MIWPRIFCNRRCKMRDFRVLDGTKTADLCSAMHITANHLWQIAMRYILIAICTFAAEIHCDVGHDEGIIVGWGAERQCPIIPSVTVLSFPLVSDFNAPLELSLKRVLHGRCPSGGPVEPCPSSQHSEQGATQEGVHLLSPKSLQHPPTQKHYLRN